MPLSLCGSPLTCLCTIKTTHLVHARVAQAQSSHALLLDGDPVIKPPNARHHTRGELLLGVIWMRTLAGYEIMSSVGAVLWEQAWAWQREADAYPLWKQGAELPHHLLTTGHTASPCCWCCLCSQGKRLNPAACTDWPTAQLHSSLHFHNCLLGQVTYMLVTIELCHKLSHTCCSTNLTAVE